MRLKKRKKVEVEVEKCEKQNVTKNGDNMRY